MITGNNRRLFRLEQKTLLMWMEFLTCTLLHTTCTFLLHVMNIWKCGCGQVPPISMFYHLEKWLYRLNCWRLYAFEIIINVTSKMKLWTHMCNIQWINSNFYFLLINLFFQEVTGKSFGCNDFRAALENGVLLCEWVHFDAFRDFHSRALVSITMQTCGWIFNLPAWLQQLWGM